MSDSNREPIHDLPPKHSPFVEHLQASLKFLAAHGVAIVNGAAILYIVLRIVLAGIQRWLNAT
jgi:hypothetical protein